METIVDFLYVYCTDFIVSLANILKLSYYEINALIFCFFYPLFLVTGLAVYFIQRYRLKKLLSTT